MSVIRFTSEFSGTYEAVNVWHFLTPTPATTTHANEAIDAVDTFFSAFPTYMRAGTWTHGNRVVTVDNTPNFVIPASPESTTTTGSSPAPNQVAAGITWQTDFIGKSYRGRSYIGPLSLLGLESDGQTIKTAFAVALGSAANALMAPTASGTQLCVWSPTGLFGNLVTSNIVRLGYRTQRRRLT